MPAMSEPLVGIATEAARRGGQVLCQHFRGRTLEIEAKAQHDFVTSADRASEEVIVGFLQEECPDHRVLTEESGRHGEAAAEYEWIVDPLDGTTNFLQGLPIWAVSIACRVSGRVVAGVVWDPLGDNLFAADPGAGATWNGKPIRVSEKLGLAGAFLATGYPFKARNTLDVYLDVFRDVFLEARAIRRCGSAALDLSLTAAGVFDGFFEFRLSIWDIAAGALLIEEAGGSVSDLDGGNDFLRTGNVLAGSSAVHRELLSTIRPLTSESHLDELDPDV